MAKGFCAGNETLSDISAMTRTIDVCQPPRDDADGAQSAYSRHWVVATTHAFTARAEPHVTCCARSAHKKALAMPAMTSATSPAPHCVCLVRSKYQETVLHFRS